MTLIFIYAPKNISILWGILLLANVLLTAIFEFPLYLISLPIHYLELNKSIHRILAILPMLALGISAMMYFFYGVAQFQYKIAAHQSIDDKKGLNSIKIPLKDFKVSDDEVWYGGKLYDISSYTIQDDSVCVVIFHDEHEENMVKSIANSFEPYDKYISDNGAHIVKHRFHPPDDSKILVTMQAIDQVTTTTKEFHPLPYFIEYPTPVYTNILKPPPNQA